MTVYGARGSRSIKSGSAQPASALDRRRPHRSATAFIVGVITAVAFSACGSGPPHSANGAVRLPTTINRVQLDQPPPGTQPAFTEPEARASLATADDMQGASKVDAVLAVVTSTSADHVLAWVFIGYDVPFINKGRGPNGKATVVEPVGIATHRALFSAAAQTS